MSLRPVKVFLSYAHEDEEHINELLKHLSLLQRQRYIEHWHHRMISPGQDRTEEIDARLEDADIIIAAVSADFLASDYCHEVELERSLARHAEGTAYVIPIIVRPTNWSSSALGRLQPLPKDGKAISTWHDRDEAWSDVSMGIQRIVQERQEAFSLTGDNRRLRSELKSAQRERERLSAECASLAQRNDALEARERELDAEVQQKIATTSHSLLGELRKASETITELNAELNKMRRQLDTKDQLIAGLTEQRQHLQSLTNRLKDDLKNAQATAERLTLKTLVRAEAISGGAHIDPSDPRVLRWHFSVRNLGEGPIRLLRTETNWWFPPSEITTLSIEPLFQEPTEADFTDGPVLQPWERSEVYELPLDVRSATIQNFLRSVDARLASINPRTWTSLLLPTVRLIVEGIGNGHRNASDWVLERQNQQPAEHPQ